MTRSGGVSPRMTNAARETRGAKIRKGEAAWIEFGLGCPGDEARGQRRGGMARRTVACGRYGAAGERRRERERMRNLTRGGGRTCPREIRAGGESAGPVTEVAPHAPSRNGRCESGPGR